MRLFILFFLLLFSKGAHAQIDSLFIREAQYHHFNGNIGIYDSEKILYENSFGQAYDKADNERTTRFDIGSISKQFTAAAILHLHHQNKLSITDPINNHLGAFANNEWKKVTIHHLLTHTSGIPSLFQTEQGLDLVFASEDAVSLDELISYFSYGDLLFKPGEEFSYNNSGYVLLATIIQEVSGMDFFEFMENEIFEKYGLTETSFTATANDAKPYYGYLPSQLKKAPIYHKSWFFGAGGIYSTVSDLSKWVQIIRSQDFLNTELRQQFLSPKVNAGGGIQYGYGWQFTSEGIIEHDGGNAGFISYLSLNPENGQHHILLTNRSFESIYELGKSSNKIRSLSDQIWQWRNGESLELHPALNEELHASTSVSGFNTEALRFKRSAEGSIILSTENIPILRAVVRTPLSKTTQLNTKFVELTQHLENHSFWKFARYCDGEMKFVAYSGLLRLGFKMMKNQVGEFQSLVPYYVDEEKGYIRMFGDEQTLDLIVYFNDDGKVMGVFDREKYPIESPTELNVYQTADNIFWVDGFPYGEHSATLEWSGNEWLVGQFGRKVPL